MASLFQSSNYGAINTADTTTNKFYVINFISEAYTLQNNTTIDRKNISAGELAVKAQYICSVQVNNNGHWEKQTLKHTTIVPTCTILHPCLNVVGITYFKDIRKTFCNRIQAKKKAYKDILFF